MQDFILTLLFNIQGIGAASGIIYNDGHLLLISDTSNCLYNYDIKTAKLDKKALEPYGIAENIPKKEKPDYEAMTLADGKLYLFGSGSTTKRNYVAAISFPDKTRTSIFDLTKLYLSMRNLSGISTEDFNIEGVTKLGDKWYFFQRGNGPGKNNGVFTVIGNITSGDCSVVYQNVALPDCNGIPATFTDALAVDDKIYFIGTAENSNSVYHDGEILGSVIGCLNPQTMEVIFTKLITKTHKFEGLALLQKTDNEITFLLCEDSDTEVTESGIYELRLPLVK
jgi:hypothetical protein